MPLALKHVARGIGGVDEMSVHLDESRVLFGVLRFVFGKGTFARTKYVACHFSGREFPRLLLFICLVILNEASTPVWQRTTRLPAATAASTCTSVQTRRRDDVIGCGVLLLIGPSCPTVKRGRANAQKIAAMEALGGASCELSFETPADCKVDAVLEVLHRTVVVDDPTKMGTFSIQSMKADIEEQLQEAKRLFEGEDPAPEARQAAAAAKKLAAAAAAAAAAVPSPDRRRATGLTLNDLGRKLTLRQALGMVRSDVAPLNWLMVTADPSYPEVVNAGSGSVPEMVRFLDDDQVFFGVLRMAFGRGVFRRCKWVFVHWSGEGVGAVKRGKANAADKPLRKVFGPTNLDHFAATREDITVEILIEKVKKFVVTDGEASDDVDRMYSLDSFMEALHEEKVAAAAEFGGGGEDDGVSEAPAPASEAAVEALQPSFAEALESVRGDVEPFNWLLAEI